MMQEEEPKLSFNKQTLDFTIAANYEAIRSAVKKHLNLFVKDLKNKFPELQCISWQQDAKPYTHEYFISVNNNDFYDRKNRKDKMCSVEELRIDGTKIYKSSVEKLYPLFIDQINEQANAELTKYNRLQEIASLASKALVAIDEKALMIAFGPAVMITASTEGFNYLYSPIPVETCDG